MQLLVALFPQPLAHGTLPFCAICSAPTKHWKFRKFNSANNQRKMFCSGLLCSSVPIQPSQDTIFSKQRLECQPLQRIKPYCKRNLYGDEYGSWQCRARLACRNAIPTKSNLVRRCVLEDSTCDLCSQDAEDVLHSLWSCPALT